MRLQISQKYTHLAKIILQLYTNNNYTLGFVWVTYKIKPVPFKDTSGNPTNSTESLGISQTELQCRLTLFHLMLLHFN